MGFRNPWRTYPMANSYEAAPIAMTLLLILQVSMLERVNKKWTEFGTWGYHTSPFILNPYQAEKSVCTWDLSNGKKMTPGNCAGQRWVFRAVFSKWRCYGGKEAHTCVKRVFCGSADDSTAGKKDNLWGVFAWKQNSTRKMTAGTQCLVQGFTRILNQHKVP